MNPAYVLDEMSMYEAGLLIESYNDDYKSTWEARRWLAYIVAASNGAKINTPEDLLKFNWEKKDVETKKLTQEEINATKERMLKKFTEK